MPDRIDFDLPNESCYVFFLNLGEKFRYEKCRQDSYPSEQVAFIVPPNAEPSSPL